MMIANLIDQASAIAQPRELSSFVQTASVGSALLTSNGNIYVGVCLDAACGLGFCAEHNAIGHMVTHGESEIAFIVAVHADGRILSPCGRCRELIYQVNPANMKSNIIISHDKTLLLQELLPEHWSG